MESASTSCVPVDCPVKAWARKYLEQAFPGRFTEQQLKDLLDEMPAVPMNWLRHRGGEGTGGFHRILGRVPADANPNGVLNGLREAYTAWDAELPTATQGLGPDIYKVVEKWLKLGGGAV